MTIQLENQQLSVKINTSGAELCSIKSKQTGLEYIWQADETVWPRHAPVLFPIVGKLKDSRFTVNGKEYTLPQHGFARDMEFEVKEANANGASFSLSANEDTLKKYPFLFALTISYHLEGAKLKVAYEVRNEGDEIMYFSIGAHPGFNCPLAEHEKFEDYYLEFDQPVNLHTHLLKDGLLSGETNELGSKVTKLPLTQRLFDKDALVFKHLNVEHLSLKSIANEHEVKVSFSGFPYLGIWTKPNTSSFICIEPWLGIADSVTSNGNMEQKEGIQSLQAREIFNAHYSIEVK